MIQEVSSRENLLLWLENSEFALFFRQSAWLYPSVEIVHIVGFAILVGAAVTYDLRLLGFSRRLSVKEATHHLTIWARLSLIAVLPSGLVLFAVNAVSLTANPAFQLKLLLIGAASLNAAYFHLFTRKTIENWDRDVRPPAVARISGGASILLWIGVISCGRLIAYV